MGTREKLNETAEAMRAHERDQADAKALASFRQYRDYKKTNPIAAAAMMNAEPHILSRGRELDSTLAKQSADAEQTTTVAQLVAAELAKKSTNTPPAATPAA
jgi:hypothetical protein